MSTSRWAADFLFDWVSPSRGHIVLLLAARAASFLPSDTWSLSADCLSPAVLQHRTDLQTWGQQDIIQSLDVRLLISAQAWLRQLFVSTRWHPRMWWGHSPKRLQKKSSHKHSDRSPRPLTWRRMSMWRACWMGDGCRIRPTLIGFSFRWFSRLDWTIIRCEHWAYWTDDSELTVLHNEWWVVFLFQPEVKQTALWSSGCKLVHSAEVHHYISVPETHCVKRFAELPGSISPSLTSIIYCVNKTLQVN